MIKSYKSYKQIKPFITKRPTFCNKKEKKMVSQAWVRQTIVDQHIVYTSQPIPLPPDQKTQATEMERVKVGSTHLTSTPWIHICSRYPEMSAKH